MQDLLTSSQKTITSQTKEYYPKVISYANWWTFAKWSSEQVKTLELEYWQQARGQDSALAGLRRSCCRYGTFTNLLRGFLNPKLTQLCLILVFFQGWAVWTSPHTGEYAVRWSRCSSKFSIHCSSLDQISSDGFQSLWSLALWPGLIMLTWLNSASRM